MKIPVEFEIDTRNYLYLLEEQGADVAAQKERLDALEETVPKEDRADSAAWQELAAEVYAMAQQWETDERSGLEDIRAARPSERTDSYNAVPTGEALRDRVAGGWYGRIAGCILGKPVECLMKEKDSRAKLRELLDASGEYPITDFISEKTILPYWQEQGTAPSWFDAEGGNPSLREYLAYAPADDDLNYTVLSLDVLKRHGREFTPDQLLDTWIGKLSYRSVCTAERNAYRNRVMGLRYPETATFLNPYSEWIGAQIRTDAYGYVCPGKPEEAARMGWADAASSHTKNGIYGGMWVSAAIAAAFCETDPRTVIQRGLEQVPQHSRFTEHMLRTMDDARANGDDFEKTFDGIQERLGHYHCVHTINNACVVAAALLHGGTDVGRVIAIAVMGGLDTDCNGATAGSIAGVMAGADAIDDAWKTRFNDTLYTSVAGRRTQAISAVIDETVSLAHA